MSYQVLARKWRPRKFAELVGQQPVVQALTNALDNDRLHHAYLFTGTRGVGKTTLARILAKSLNCETGVSSQPCGECSICREIDEGRFADLLEVDAASRTKVEQTRELLENVPYAPVRGRYKVYLIDEVHMFSDSSFNALLKTLEEPPPHVKFLLATTDPQKVPVTVLSRCLQFNLKRIPADRIQAHLEDVLGRESAPFETPALRLLARAADGSMRDSLSLLDQAIAFGAGQVREADVRAMLGALEGEYALHLLQGLAAGDAAAVLAQAAEIAERAPDFGALLQELLALLHRVALAQMVAETLDDSQGDEAALRDLAAAMSPEDCQLFYQIGLIGQRDLPLAPDPRSGFEMVLLRMLAFRPTDAGAPPPSGAPVRRQSAPAAGHSPPPTGAAAPAETGPKAVRSILESAAPGRATPQERPGTPTQPPRAETERRPAAAQPAATPPEAAADAQPEARALQAKPEPAPVIEPQPEPVIEPQPAPQAADLAADQAHPPAAPGDPAAWPELVQALRLGGMARQLAANCICREWAADRIELVLDQAHRQLRVARTEDNLRSALERHFGRPMELRIRAGQVTAVTPAGLAARDRERRLHEAEQIMLADPLSRSLQEQFGARLVAGSARPLD